MERRELLKTMVLTAGGLLLPVRTVFGALSTRISDVRVWTAPDHTRIVFELDKKIPHKLFRLSNPERVVLDMENTHTSAISSEILASDPLIKNFRVGTPRPGVTRAVFEVSGPVRPRSFVLDGVDGKGPRLVLDLHNRRAATMSRKKSHASKPRTAQKNHKVIVIDPGHGGEDPGAIGRYGTKEKDVALSVGKRLAARINQTQGYRAYLTRKGDYFVSLGKRVRRAREHSPDLFISLHADAFKDQSARGASVYCLSENNKPSPDRAIQQLVARENSADLIGGINLRRDVEPDVAKMLMDLSQRDSINRAHALGEKILGSLRTKAQLKLHYKRVKKAGFAVLKAPDMPSVLVEMAFLTNPHEERQLRRRSHQTMVADALFSGAKRFFRNSTA